MTAAFAGGGLALMLAGGLLSMLWFGRLPGLDPGPDASRIPHDVLS